MTILQYTLNILASVWNSGPIMNAESSSYFGKFSNVFDQSYRSDLSLSHRRCMGWQFLFDTDGKEKSCPLERQTTGARLEGESLQHSGDQVTEYFVWIRLKMHPQTDISSFIIKTKK